MSHYSGATPLNIGAGHYISILDLTRLVMELIGYDGAIEHDLGKPDGTPRKLFDVSRLAALRWTAKVRSIKAWRLPMPTGWRAGEATSRGERRGSARVAILLDLLV